MSFRCHSTTSAARAAVHMLAAALCAALVACGGGGSAPPPSVGQATIDAAGGTVEGPDGVQLVVPAAALATATTVRIARDATGAPELGGAKAISPVYSVTPHGTQFAESARISIPFRAADLAPGTQPVLLRAQPGGTGWEALPTEVRDGTVSAADTPGLSYYTVGSCYTTLDITSPYELSPLFACPNAHTLQLTLLDGNGAVLPLPRVRDLPQPAMTITAPTTLNYTLSWARPSGTVRSDTLDVTVSGIGLLPAQQPLRNFSTPRDFARTFTTGIDPATVPGASAAGGVIIRLRATASYTTDAFYFGCACFKPATWTFSTEIPVRVVYTGTQPVITQQPQNRNVVAGQTAAFSVVATGANLSYQWSSFRGQNQAVLFGATQSTYTTSATTMGDDNTFYTVEVCSNRGTAQQRCINSDAAVLRVTQTIVAPAFAQAPQSISVQSGQTASFSATASGRPAPTITWARVTSAPGAFFVTLDPICSSTAGSGTQTSATCTIGPVSQGDNGMRIVAQASNDGGSINSPEAVLTVTAPPVAPTITSPAQPDDRTITAGQGVSWTVTASGTAPISFAWRTVSPTSVINDGGVCDQSVPGNSRLSATLTLTNVPLACNGYRFQASASNGVTPEALSRQALLTVNPAPAAPSITTALANRSVNDGTSVTFSVAATGTPSTFSYTWTLDGIAVSSPTSGCNASSASCTFTARLADTGKTIRVVVSNGTAPDATSQATLTVTTTDVAATITSQPANRTVVEGESASFTVGTAGTPTPTIAWQTNNGSGWVDAGVTSATYTIAATTLAQTGLHVRALVGNTIATVGGPQGVSVTSNEATLTVTAANPPGMVLFAGDFSSAGTATGTGTAARFDSPQGLTADGSGNLYVASSNGKFVSRITPSAAVTHLFFAPIIATSFFANPALAPDGSLFIGSYSWCGLWRATPPLTAPTQVAEITLANCPVYVSNGLSVDSQTRVAIADTSRHAIIRATQQPDGAWTQTYFAGATDYFGGDANRGSIDATGTAARFSGPTGLAYAANGDLFVADHDNGTIRRITPAGEVSTFAGAAGQQGTLDGTGTAARFDRPYGLAFDPAGNLIVLQLGASPAVPAWVRRITPAGVVTTLFDARAEAAALATDGNAVANARSVKGVAAPGTNRIALSAGNAVLLRTLP